MLTLIPKTMQFKNDPTDPYNRVGKNFATTRSNSNKPVRTDFIASLVKLNALRKMGK